MTAVRKKMKILDGNERSVSVFLRSLKILQITVLLEEETAGTEHLHR